MAVEDALRPGSWPPPKEDRVAIGIRGWALTRTLAIALTGSTIATFLPTPQPARAAGYLTGTATHAPPSTGAYAYYATFGTFGPGHSGFPGIGGSFVDPIFGSTIRRLTNEIGQHSESEIYSKNGYYNADGTVVHHRSPSGHTLLNTTTGQIVRSGVAFNFDSSFAPDNADLWYHFAWGDASLYRYSVSTGTRTLVKTFPGALGELGGSVDWIDRSGRYMVLRIAGAIRVWDKATDTLYAGSIPSSAGSGGGWVGISPDGNYVITSTPPTSSQSWRINHATHSVSTSPVTFWTLCGGHGDLVSASNGKTYFVTFDCHTTGSVYAVDVSLPQSAGNVSQQLSQNRKLVQLASWADVDGHFSGVSKGALQDWTFMSIESGDDGFTSLLTGWRPYKQELMMANVVTGEVRRLAHHRSRGLETSYYAQPRVNASWTGNVIGWTSNFGSSGSGYADLYVMPISGASSGTSTSSPTVSFSAPASGATVSGTTTVAMSASGGSGTGYSYTLKIDGVTVSTGPSAYAWNTTAYATGAHTLAVTVTDSSGATGSATRTVNVSNATSALSATFTNPGSGATVSGTVTVSVAASGGSGYTYTVKAGTSTIYSGTNGSFSWNTTATPNGGVTLTATVKAGTLTASASRAVTVSNSTSSGTADTTLPTVTITTPTTNVWTGNSIQVGASATDNKALSRIELWGAGTKFATFPCSGTSCAGSTWWITGSLATAAYQVNAVAVDTAGNRRVSASRTIYKDATSPLIGSGAGSSTTTLGASFTSPASGATVSGTVTVGMAVSGASGSTTFTLKRGTTTLATKTVTGSSTSYAWNTAGLSGSQTLSLTATNNGRTASASRTVTVSTTSTSTGDTTPPTVAITSPASGVWTGNSLDIAATASDNVKVTSIRFYGDGVLFGTIPCSAATCSGTMLWLTGSLPSGTHRVSALATDSSGRTTWSSPITVYK